MNANKFSMRERRKSFGYAWCGLKALLTTEHNAYIHFTLTIAAFLLSFILRISKGELITIIVVITLVWMAELFNTAIEKAMDFISIEQHQQIKLVKDLAAAAVLISAIAALLIGCIVFIPKLLQYA